MRVTVHNNRMHARVRPIDRGGPGLDLEVTGLRIFMPASVSDQFIWLAESVLQPNQRTTVLMQPPYNSEDPYDRADRVEFLPVDPLDAQCHDACVVRFHCFNDEYEHEIAMRADHLRALIDLMDDLDSGRDELAYEPPMTTTPVSPEELLRSEARWEQYRRRATSPANQSGEWPSEADILLPGVRSEIMVIPADGVPWDGTPGSNNRASAKTEDAIGQGGGSSFKEGGGIGKLALDLTTTNQMNLWLDEDEGREMVALRVDDKILTMSPKTALDLERETQSLKLTQEASTESFTIIPEPDNHEPHERLYTPHVTGPTYTVLAVTVDDDGMVNARFYIMGSLTDMTIRMSGHQLHAIIEAIKALNPGTRYSRVLRL